MNRRRPASLTRGVVTGSCLTARAPLGFSPLADGSAEPFCGMCCLRRWTSWSDPRRYRILAVGGKAGASGEASGSFADSLICRWGSLSADSPIELNLGHKLPCEPRDRRSCMGRSDQAGDCPARGWPWASCSRTAGYERTAAPVMSYGLKASSHRSQQPSGDSRRSRYRTCDGDRHGVRAQPRPGSQPERLDFGPAWKPTPRLARLAASAASTV